MWLADSCTLLKGVVGLVRSTPFSSPQDTFHTSSNRIPAMLHGIPLDVSREILW
jgi:hypothetical protein